MLSMFTRHTGSDSATSTDHETFSHFTSKRLALHSALAMCIACASSTLLTGCGGGTDPTTRVSATTPPATAPATTYVVTIKSPVLLTNVRARVIDASTGALIDQTIITSANTAGLTIPVKLITPTNVLILSLEPIDKSSTYYDPMLASGKGGTAPFNQTLHAAISMNNANSAFKVDPFSEIAYQRALIRSGTIDPATPLLSRLSMEQIGQANTDTTKAFGTETTTPYAANDFNSPADVAAVHIYLTASIINTGKSLNYSSQSSFFALAQLALYAQNNSSDASPYLNFALRAALDLRDGDLDGMTIVGGESVDTVNIANPILYSGVTSQVNSDPDHSDYLSLATINTAQRNARGSALKTAANLYFDAVNAALPAASRMDSDTVTYLQNANYALFSAPPSTSNILGGGTSTSSIPPSQVGAGNYTRAFGLPSGVNQKTAIYAIESTEHINDIAQLTGAYKNTSGCQLNIGYDGSIQFSQGSKLYKAVISGDYADSIVRISGTQYRVNIITGDVTAPAFIQITVDGAQVTSAVEGRSSLLIPSTLDTVDLSCSF